MLAPDVLSETLATAMGTGAEFAEVFVEDRRSMSALFDDGRVEERHERPRPWSWPEGGRR